MEVISKPKRPPPVRGLAAGRATPDGQRTDGREGADEVDIGRVPAHDGRRALATVEDEGAGQYGASGSGGRVSRSISIDMRREGWRA
jgi:hypothetical protein